MFLSIILDLHGVHAESYDSYRIFSSLRSYAPLEGGGMSFAEVFVPFCIGIQVFFELVAIVLIPNSLSLICGGVFSSMSSFIVFFSRFDKTISLSFRLLYFLL